MPIRPEMLARYPKDWKARSRFVRFYRARNRCEWCGAENYQPHPDNRQSKVVLTTAHVWDMRPEACSLLNLAALCQRCHNRCTTRRTANATGPGGTGKWRWFYDPNSTHAGAVGSAYGWRTVCYLRAC